MFSIGLGVPIFMSSTTFSPLLARQSCKLHSEQLESVRLFRLKMDNGDLLRTLKTRVSRKFWILMLFGRDAMKVRFVVFEHVRDT